MSVLSSASGRVRRSLLSLLLYVSGLSGCFLDSGAIQPVVDAARPMDASVRDAGSADSCLPVTESCNGLDDDCNGIVDDGLSRACDTACGSGTETCAAGAWRCDAPAPLPEVCNNLDDDCNGRIDDDLSRHCATSCGDGTERCSGGVWQGCEVPGAPPEVCNGFDDDCNGHIDDGLSRACTNDCGSGTETCSAGAWVGCNAPAPADETCNGIDDDCDGMIDEALSRTCFGACGTGTETCDLGSWVGCDAPGPMVETCDGVDDDCDGMVDEGGVCPCPVESHLGRTYQFCDADTWSNARATCTDHGYESRHSRDQRRERLGWHDRARHRQRGLVDRPQRLELAGHLHLGQRQRQHLSRLEQRRASDRQRARLRLPRRRQRRDRGDRRLERLGLHRRAPLRLRSALSARSGSSPARAVPHRRDIGDPWALSRVQRGMRTLAPWSITAAALCLSAALVPVSVRAESWCAYPLWIHEWGVQTFEADGRRVATPLPSYFHGAAPHQASSTAPPVRDLPPDTGVRALPILQAYSAGSLSDPIPLGVEVGFAEGAATRWFPQVDRLTAASAANAPEAQAGRRALVEARRQQDVVGPRRALGPDPTRQLEWSHLELTHAAAHAPAPSSTPWVASLRAMPGALWANTTRESERFVFYEADTRERVAIEVTTGPQYGPGRRHYVLRNTGAFPIHDVFVIHREAGALFVFSAPAIPAGASAGFVLEEHRVAPGREEASTRDLLRAQLVDAAEPAPPAHYRWNGADCVMQRDPAVPVDHAEGHRLYTAEVDAILSVWGARFFEQPGTTILYREDTAYLDRVMPLSIYTDMYNFPRLRRAGLALWSGVTLPVP